MLEIILVVLVVVCVVIVGLMGLWVNQMAHALNALAQRVHSLEQSRTQKANDPVANFKTL